MTRLQLKGGLENVSTPQTHGFLTLLQAPCSVKQQIDAWGCNGNTIDLMRPLNNNLIQIFESFNCLCRGT